MTCLHSRLFPGGNSPSRTARRRPAPRATGPSMIQVCSRLFPGRNGPSRTVRGRPAPGETGRCISCVYGRPIPVRIGPSRMIHGNPALRGRGPSRILQDRPMNWIMMSPLPCGRPSAWWASSSRGTVAVVPLPRTPIAMATQYGNSCCPRRLMTIFLRHNIPVAECCKLLWRELPLCLVIIVVFLHVPRMCYTSQAVSKTSGKVHTTLCRSHGKIASCPWTFSKVTHPLIN